MASQYKQENPRCLVAVGGPHPSSMPEEAIAEPAVDYVVVGEAERAIVDLCECVSGGPPDSDALRKIPGLVFKTADGPAHNPAGPPLTDVELEQLPWPRFDSMNLKGYFKNTHPHGLFRAGSVSCPS